MQDGITDPITSSPARLVSSPARALAGVLNSAPATFQLFDERPDDGSDGFRSVQPSFHLTGNTHV